MLDEIVQLQPSEIPSTEDAPLYFEGSRKLLWGGAANVAKNCSRLGARVYLIHEDGPVSFDSDDLLTADEQLRIVQMWSKTQRVVKRRYYVGDRKILKINKFVTYRQRDPQWAAGAIESVLNKFSADVVIACDNGHDMFDAESASAVLQSCQRHGKPLYVDAQLSQKRPDFSIWSGADSIFLNATEYNAMPSRLLGTFKTYHVKRGDEGSLYYDGDSMEVQPAFRLTNVIDPLGAGDAYLSAWAVHSDLKLANAWASLSCGYRGTEMPELCELENLDETFVRFSQPR